MRKSIAIFSLAAISGIAISGIASVPAHAESANKLGLKRRSEFKAINTGHNPFWPIGWAKKETGPAQPAIVSHRVKLLPENFLISSISVGRVSAAVINGKIYSEGDFVPLGSGAQKIEVQVIAVSDNGVKLKYRNSEITAHIRRAELHKLTQR